LKEEALKKAAEGIEGRRNKKKTTTKTFLPAEGVAKSLFLFAGLRGTYVKPFA